MRTILCSLLFILGLTMSGCTTLPRVDDGRERVSVPYTLLPSGHYVVEIRIDGEKPLPVIIDTGSAMSGIFERALGQTSITVDPERTIIVRGLLDSRPRPVVDTESITLGPTRQKIERLLVLRDPEEQKPVFGLLGMDFLQHYTLVFDDASRTVAFIPAAEFSEGPYRTWRRADLDDGPRQNPFSFHFVEMQIGPDRLPALLDTGSQTTVLNTQAFETLSVFRTARRARRERTRLQGSTATAEEIFTVEVPGIRVGEVSWGPGRVVVLPLDPLEPLGATDGPFAIMGNNLLNRKSFVLDFTNDRLLIKPVTRGTGNQTWGAEESPAPLN